jgi:hypothetical protein
MVNTRVTRYRSREHRKQCRFPKIFTETEDFGAILEEATVATVDPRLEPSGVRGEGTSGIPFPQLARSTADQRRRVLDGDLQRFWLRFEEETREERLDLVSLAVAAWT